MRAYLEREVESEAGEGGEDTEPALLEDVVQLAEHTDLSPSVTPPAPGLGAPVQQRPEPVLQQDGQRRTDLSLGRDPLDVLQLAVKALDHGDVLVLLGLHVVEPLAGRHVGQEGSLAGDDLVADEAEGPVVH